MKRKKNWKKHLKTSDMKYAALLLLALFLSSGISAQSKDAKTLRKEMEQQQEQGKKEAAQVEKEAASKLQSEEKTLREEAQQVEEETRKLRDKAQKEGDNVSKAAEEAVKERKEVAKRYGTNLNQGKAEAEELRKLSMEEVRKLPPVERKEAMEVKTADKLIEARQRITMAEARIAKAKEELERQRAAGELSEEEAGERQKRIDIASNKAKELRKVMLEAREEFVKTTNAGKNEKQGEPQKGEQQKKTK